jgi:sec-independent protein translocase protein TatB
MGHPPPIQLATLSMWDTLLLMALALVVFGPRRLPMIGRQIGKLMYEFRKASNDFKFQMEEEFRAAEEADRRKKEEEERQRALAGAQPAAQLESTTSQAAESAAATPESTPPAASTESPYPGEITYPAPAVDAAPAEDPAPPAAEAATPRIQPPSTGETVAADRPGAQPQQDERAAAEPGADTESVTAEAERSESAAHG